MKKSDMVNYIVDIMRSYKLRSELYNLDTIANVILDSVEEQGMLPPCINEKKECIFCNGDHTNKWTSER